MNLIYDYYDAYYKAGKNDNAFDVMRELGIKYERSEAHTIIDAIIFYGCTNTPSPLPIYLEELKQKDKKENK